MFSLSIGYTQDALSWIQLKRIRCRKKEKAPRPSATLWYRMMSGDSFERPIFFLELLLVVALDRRPAWRRVPSLNHLSSPYTLTNQKSRCMSHVISTHRPGDPTCPRSFYVWIAPRFEHSTLIVRAKKNNYSAIAALL